MPKVLRQQDQLTPAGLATPASAGRPGELRLERELRQQVAAALETVPGAGAVAEEDRESWYVTGTPSGEALIRAAARVVDRLADRARAYIDSG